MLDFCRVDLNVQNVGVASVIWKGIVDQSCRDGPVYWLLTGWRFWPPAVIISIGFCGLSVSTSFLRCLWFVASSCRLVIRRCRLFRFYSWIRFIKIPRTFERRSSLTRCGLILKSVLESINLLQVRFVYLLDSRMESETICRWQVKFFNPTYGRISAPVLRLVLFCPWFWPCRICTFRLASLFRSPVSIWSPFEKLDRVQYHFRLVRYTWVRLKRLLRSLTKATYSRGPVH